MIKIFVGDTICGQPHLIYLQNCIGGTKLCHHCADQSGKHYKVSIHDFRKKWFILHDKFGVNIPNKVHILVDHAETYMGQSSRG